MQKRVKLLRTGTDQIVVMPRELELPCENAVIRREGEGLVIEPAPSLLAVLAR